LFFIYEDFLIRRFEFGGVEGLVLVHVGLCLQVVLSKAAYKAIVLGWKCTRSPNSNWSKGIWCL